MANIEEFQGLGVTQIYACKEFLGLLFRGLLNMTGAH
jgi:hypothetical protein